MQTLALPITITSAHRSDSHFKSIWHSRFKERLALIGQQCSVTGLEAVQGSAACAAQIQSTMATVRKEEVAKAAQGAPLMMLQLYVTKNRDFCRKLILGKP